VGLRLKGTRVLGIRKREKGSTNAPFALIMDIVGIVARGADQKILKL
jgi:hypothetical protein